MRRWWRAWVELLSRRERGTTLALFRIATALVIVYSLLSIAGAGLVELLWVDAAHGGYRTLPVDHWLLRALGGATSTTIWTLYAVSLGATVAMALGLGSRWAIGLVAVTYPPLATVNGDASGGYDLMLGNAIWLLLLGQATETVSLDCRRRTGRWTSEQEVFAWPRYVAVFQLIVIYTSTGLHKLSADWVPGGSHSALYWVFQDPTWNRFDLREIAAGLYPVTQFATATVWAWEVATVGLLAVFYFRNTRGRPGLIRAVFNRYDLRKPWALVGVGLHVGILLLLEVGPFSWISLAYYLCLWTPAELERFARRNR